MWVCARYLDFLKYFERKILDRVNEKIVFALEDQVTHLANTTVKRVEATHATVQNWLRNSKGDFCRGWDYVN